MAIPILGGIIDAVIGKAGDIIDQVVVDKDKKLQAKVDLERLRIEMIDKGEQRLHEQMMGQVNTNIEEAKSESVFVSGWRPAVGWFGAIGVGWSFVVQPVLSWTAEVVFKYSGSYPALNVDSLMALLMGMLGFGGLRTYEKLKGVAQAPPEDGGPTNLIPASFDDLPEQVPWAK